MGMMKLVKWLFISNVLMIVFFLIFSLRLPGDLCAPFLNKINKKTPYEIDFDELDFSLRQLRFINFEIKKDSKPLLKAETLRIAYLYRFLFKGDPFSFDIKAKALNLYFAKLGLNFNMLGMKSFSCKVNGKMIDSFFHGACSLKSQGINSEGEASFLKGLGKLLNISALKKLGADRAQLDFTIDDSKIKFSKAFAESSDISLEGNGEYLFEKGLSSEFELSYSLPFQKSNDGANAKKLKFSVHGPISNLGYRIRG
ncbi:hypothetical protein AB834_05300 [PVC group bacterium (ex Bugula neritina AB1)]|nr:hypothetical protein AB834_05300 [PVC group bacterium (ex Bugula neritina AB1)]